MFFAPNYNIDYFIKFPKVDLLKHYGYTINRKIETWNDEFNGLKEVIKASKQEKKAVFIDELSWMDT